jgi:hypothetical protein
MRFEQELLKMLGAGETYSKRSEEFKHILWDASAFLDPHYMASREAAIRSKQNRQLIRDDSPDFVEDASQSAWTREESAEDEIFW